MPLWRRDTTSTDPAAGDDELAAVLKPRSLDLAAALALLDSRPAGSETRAHAVHVIGTDPRLDDALAAAGRDIEDEPGGTAALMAAVRAHNLAWEARGRAVTSMTTEGQLDEFHARLEDAERRLLAMARTRADDDVPYWYLLSCARGLRRDEDVVQTRFDMLRKVAPDHRRGHSHVLRCVSPKWYGSLQGMVDFAWACSEGRPGGSTLHGIVAEALVEGGVSFVGAGPPDLPASEAFWADQRTHDQLQIAYRSFASGADDHGAPWRVRDLNTFVYAAARTGCVDEGRHAAEALQGRVSDYPWRYFADDVAAAYETTVKQLTG
jgi:hypothetical protein